MGFHYGKAIRRLHCSWERWEPRLRENGMNEKDIQELKEFDMAQLRSDRRFYRHNLSLSDIAGADSQIIDSFLRKFEGLYCLFDEESFSEENDWIHAIHSSEIAAALKLLNKSQLKIISMRMEGFTQQEIAAHFKITQAAVSHRIRTIRAIIMQHNK